MGQILHGSATTTEAVRRAIQHSQESLRALAKRYGINQKTVAKWKARTSVADVPTGPKNPKSTVLSVEDEAIVVAFRRHTLLPLDDCLYALQATIPHLTRSSLHRCLQRHGISRLPEVDGDRPVRKTFKSYPIGYIHIDIAEIQTAEGKLYLYVAIDRTSKFAVVQLVRKTGRTSAAAFLTHVIETIPYAIHTVLTDNGVQFTYQARHADGPTARYMTHMFDMRCRENGIEHRLTKVKHPWTNSQVERMNRTIKEATVKRYHYDSHEQFEIHLTDFIAAYNYGRRLKTLRGLTPYEYICKIWMDQPKGFRIDPLHQMPGLNTYALAEAVPSASAGNRLEIIDRLRGLVIVVMVLDHVRDFFHADAFRFSPTDLEKTTAILFATRWVTHLCAPTFVFLAGVSVYLQWSRGRRGWRLASFLATRGLWLIALEVTLVTMAFTFAWDGALLQVIWAIGLSMILLGGLCWLPPPALLAVGLAIVCGHDLLDGIDSRSLGAWSPFWTLMLKPGSVHLAFGHGYVAYPALPWFGIMAVGFGVGGLFLRPTAQRDRILVATGLAMLLAFALLRGLDLYGDPSPWKSQADVLHTDLSFLKVTKYPPSLDYALATLGITLSIAPFVARIGGPMGGALLAFGRTPLFTYLLHLYVARGLAVLLALAEGIPPSVFHDTFGSGDALAKSGWGVNLFWVYVAWITVVMILWPISTWYAGVKARRRDWWLGYL